MASWASWAADLPYCAAARFVSYTLAPNRVDDDFESPLMLLGHPIEVPTAHHVGEVEDEEEELSAQLDELFFDLIFVAAILKLGDYLKARLTVESFFISMLIFMLLWTSWFHVTTLYSRFHIPAPWKAFLYFVMLGTAGIALHSVDLSKFLIPGDLGKLEIKKTVGEPFVGGLAMSALLSRLAVLGVYLAVWRWSGEGSHLGRCYSIHLGLSCGLFLLSAFMPFDVAAAIWSINIVMETAMYWFGALNPENRLPVNIGYSIERNSLWVILVLGETVIALITPELVCQCFEHYANLIIGFSSLYNIFKMYSDVQPSFEFGLDIHALDTSFVAGMTWSVVHGFMTFFMFCLGVGMKSLVQHTRDGFYEQKDAYLLFTGFVGTVLFLDASRFTHSWFSSNIRLFGFENGRLYVWVVHALLAASSMVLPQFESALNLNDPDPMVLQDVLDKKTNRSGVTLKDFGVAYHKATDEALTGGQTIRPVWLLAGLLAYTIVLRMLDQVALKESCRESETEQRKKSLAKRRGAVQYGESGLEFTEAEENQRFSLLELAAEIPPEYANAPTESKDDETEAPAPSLRRRKFPRFGSLNGGPQTPWDPLSAVQRPHRLRDHHSLRHVNSSSTVASLRRSEYGTLRQPRHRQDGHQRRESRRRPSLVPSNHRVSTLVENYSTEAILDRSQLRKSITKMKVFDGWTSLRLAKATNAFQLHTVHQGEVIVELGAVADFLLVVGSGSFELRTSFNDSEETVIGVLTVGSVWGEVALLHPHPSNCTVLAQTKGFFWMLTAAQYNSIRGGERRTMPRSLSGSGSPLRLNSISSSSDAAEDHDGLRPRRATLGSQPSVDSSAVVRPKSWADFHFREGDAHHDGETHPSGELGDNGMSATVGPQDGAELHDFLVNLHHDRIRRALEDGDDLSSDTGLHAHSAHSAHDDHGDHGGHGGHGGHGEHHPLHPHSSHHGHHGHPHHLPHHRHQGRPHHGHLHHGHLHPPISNHHGLRLGAFSNATSMHSLETLVEIPPGDTPEQSRSGSDGGDLTDAAADNEHQSPPGPLGWQLGADDPEVNGLAAPAELLDLDAERERVLLLEEGGGGGGDGDDPSDDAGAGPGQSSFV